MTAAKTVTVYTDPGHEFVPAIDGKHQDKITEFGAEVKAADLDKIVASANENGIRLTTFVADEPAMISGGSPTTDAGVGPQKQEG